MDAARRFQLAASALICAGAAYAEPPTSEDFGAAIGTPELISLATGYERPLFDAPITATVITRNEIERSEVRTLADLLERVPGYYVASQDARSTQVSVRGITQRILLLVDGLPLYQGYVNATQSLHDIFLFDVERVEITKGPGSAIYGADAAAGIINLVTRTSSSSPLAEAGVLAGNTQTAGAYGLYGASAGNVDLRLYGAYYETDFNDRALVADAQTHFDRLLRTDVSLAPGPLNAGRRVLDTRARATLNGWSLSAAHMNEYDFQTGTGITFALDPTGTYDSRISNIELSHQQSMTNDWSIRTNLMAIEVEQRAADMQLFPPGAFRGLFPEGVKQAFDVREMKYRGEFSVRYNGIRSHKLLAMAGAFSSDFDTLLDVRNYVARAGAVVPTFMYAPAAGVGDAEVIADANREVWYVVLQDEWTPIPDWTLTIGARFDEYSDFGGTFNPRAAVVWTPNSRSNVKLLYGTAFRPPSVVELESNGTFAALGNAALKPVELQMTELSFSHRLDRYEVQVSAFMYHQQDLVQTAPYSESPIGLIFVNRSSDEGVGFETSVEFRATPWMNLTGHYSYQEHGKASRDNANAQQSPRHQLGVNAQLNLDSHWHADVFALGIFDRGRASDDPRPAPRDYALVNLALRRSNLPAGFELSLTIHNAFDEYIVDPSDSPTTLAADVPTRGRAWIGELRKRF